MRNMESEAEKKDNNNPNPTSSSSSDPSSSSNTSSSFMSSSGDVGNMNCSKQHYNSISEYTKACRTWMWQYQYSQYQWTNYAAAVQNAMMPFYFMSFLSATACGQTQTTSTTSMSQFPRTAATLSDQSANNVQQSATSHVTTYTVYRIPPIWKRVVAEFIDFILLLLVKVGVTCVLVDITGSFSDIHPLNVDLEHIITTGQIDYEKMIALTTEVVVMEVINRVFISLFEAMCLRHGVNMIGGSTPGKRIMGLCVVSCDDVSDLGDDTVRISPARNLGLWSALVRSVIKNFSLAFLFPLCFTALAFQHNRAVYDVLANSVVVEINNQQLQR